MVKSVFNPERLIAARIYKDLTITELSEKLGVSKQMVSQYEKGRANPSLEILMKLAYELGFSRDYFYKEDFKIDIENTFFRALASTPKRELQAQKLYSLLISEIFDVLDRYVTFPKLNLPKTMSSDPEKVAEQLRDYWDIGFGPVNNILLNLEKNGILVTTCNSNQLRIDAFVQHQRKNEQDRFIMVLTNDKKSYARRQFNAAHELGHCCLHKDKLIVEDLSAEEFREMENEANEFASAFLLPSESFLEDLYYPNKLDFYVELKKKWKVSIQMMIIRAYRLDAINYNQYQYLMRQLSARGWRKQEPLDDVLVMKKPQAFYKALELIIYNGVMTGPELLKELGYSKENLEALLDLENDEILSHSEKEVGNLVTLNKPIRDIEA